MKCLAVVIFIAGTTGVIMISGLAPWDTGHYAAAPLPEDMQPRTNRDAIIQPPVVQLPGDIV